MSQLLASGGSNYWSFSFSINPSNAYSRLISCRIDCFDLLAFQGTLKSLLQHCSLETLIHLYSVLFIVQLSHSYVTTGKTIAILSFVSTVLSLLFNTLSRLVKSFLPNNKCLLLSWLQLPSTVILETKKIKSVTASTLSLSKEESEKVDLKLNIQKTKIMASGPITSRKIDGERVADFIFWAPKITADDDCSHEIKRCLLLGKKVMTNLDSILKSRDITLSTKVHLIRAMVFPVVMHGCESWTIKKAERQRIDAFELWCWRRPLRVQWTAKRSNQSTLKEISPEWSLEGLMLKLKLQYFDYLI